MSVEMPLPTRKRALQLGAAFIEEDLHKLRRDVQALYLAAEREKRDPIPVSTSHEADIMKAAEWASAAAMLRMMAEAVA